MDFIKLAVHSSEEKPRRASNAVVIEYDTGKQFFSTGGTWHEIPAASGVDPQTAINTADILTNTTGLGLVSQRAILFPQVSSSTPADIAALVVLLKAAGVLTN